VSDHYRKFATIYFARSFVLVFCRWHIIATQKEIAHIIMDKKLSGAAGSTPARAAQGMATTSCCGKFLPDRGEKISCRFSLIALRLAAQQIETAVRGCD